jgi:uncharacterized membrane protein YhaH (DUF805 family)
MRYFIRYFRHMTDFNGRSNRREFWNAQLLAIVTSFLVTLAYRAAVDSFSGSLSGKADAIMDVSVVLYYLVIILSSFALISRRLHDIGASALISPLALIFFPLSFILLAVWKGQDAPNRFGEPPRPFPLGESAELIDGREIKPSHGRRV